jgi:hypothetical protein
MGLRFAAQREYLSSLRLLFTCFIALHENHWGTASIRCITCGESPVAMLLGGL